MWNQIYVKIRENSKCFDIGSREKKAELESNPMYWHVRY